MENTVFGALILHMGNAHAIAWHRQCGTRNTQPLFSVGRGRNSFDRITRSSAEGDHLGSEYDVGVALDRGECDEISGVEDTNGGIDIRY